MVRVWVLSLATLVVACAMTHGRAGVQAAASVVRPIDGTDSDLALATRFRATVRIVAEQVDKVRARAGHTGVCALCHAD